MIPDIRSTVTKAAGSALSTANGALGALQGGLNTASALAGALNNLSNPAGLISALRAMGAKKGADGGGQVTSNASVMFGGDEAKDGDWRVRLSVPAAFKSSGILKPLVEANGLIFPYTPTISISSSANYEDVPMTHQNYSFLFYQNSRADQITINAPFNVEDSAQGAYWLAAVHMLRSCTKMFTGDGSLQGNPPPILKLNGYGDYVFKNVPVVIKSFSVELPADANYINTSAAVATVGPAAGGGVLSTIAGISGTVGQLAGLAGALGNNKLANNLGRAGAIGGAIAGVGSLLTGVPLPNGGPFGAAGTSWVPVKSTMSITLQPIYSREAMRQFSLQRFVSGEYVDGGYI